MAEMGLLPVGHLPRELCACITIKKPEALHIMYHFSFHIPQLISYVYHIIACRTCSTFQSMLSASTWICLHPSGKAISSRVCEREGVADGHGGRTGPEVPSALSSHEALMCTSLSCACRPRWFRARG